MARMILRDEHHADESGWLGLKTGCPHYAFSQCGEQLFGVAGGKTSHLRFDRACCEFAAA